MREHKVRGYEPIGHVWWYGTSDVTSIDAKSRIAPLSRFWQWVEDEKLANVGDWIGRKDKNGTEIYEGDVVCNEGVFVATTWVVEWQQGEHEAGFALRSTSKESHEEGGYLWIGCAAKFEVIGNVWENPELLEAQDGCH